MADGLEAWLAACRKGDLQFVQDNISTYKTKVNSLGESGLMLASYFNKPDIVKALLYFEYTIGNSDGYTALMYAVCAGNLDICKLLVDREGCYVLRDGTTALMLAVKCGHAQVVEFLCPYMDSMKDSNNETALLHAIQTGRLVMVKKLIEKTQSMTADDIRMAASYAEKQNQQAIHVFLKGVENTFPETRPAPSITPRYPKIMRPSTNAPVVKKTKIDEYFAGKAGVLGHITQSLMVPHSIIKRAASKSSARASSRKSEANAASCPEDTPPTPQVSLEHTGKDIATDISSSSLNETHGWIHRSWEKTVDVFYRGLSKTKQVFLRIFARKVAESATAVVSSSVSNSMSV